jgi:hypothetical protein
MELDRLNPLGAVADAGHSTIIQMPMGDLKVIRHPLLLHRITVIL